MTENFCKKTTDKEKKRNNLQTKKRKAKKSTDRE